MITMFGGTSDAYRKRLWFTVSEVLFESTSQKSILLMWLWYNIKFTMDELRIY